MDREDASERAHTRECTSIRPTTKAQNMTVLRGATPPAPARSSARRSAAAHAETYASRRVSRRDQVVSGGGPERVPSGTPASPTPRRLPAGFLATDTITVLRHVRRAAMPRRL